MCSVGNNQSWGKAVQDAAEQGRDENSLVSSWGFGPKSICYLQNEFLLTLSVAWILFQAVKSYISDSKRSLQVQRHSFELAQFLCAVAQGVRIDGNGVTDIPLIKMNINIFRWSFTSETDNC